MARARTKRLGGEERRLLLVRAAAALLSEGGPDAVQFADVAKRAKVTRPLVYRFFPTRQALLVAVLEDFTGALSQRFFEYAARSMPGEMLDVARAFVDAICDTIEERGAGPWHLLGSGGPDPEVARAAAAMHAKLIEPWRPAVVELTGATPREVATVTHMLVAAGRAVLALWYAGNLTRREAARDTARGVSALLGAFTTERKKADSLVTIPRHAHRAHAQPSRQ